MREDKNWSDSIALLEGQGKFHLQILIDRKGIETEYRINIIPKKTAEGHTKMSKPSALDF